jgi:cytochrome c peroxidase
MHHLNTLFAITVVTFSITACQSSDTSELTVSVDSDSAIDKQLKQIISVNKLTGNVMQGRQTPDISSPEAQLGMRLFFSKSLGGDQGVACVTCHHPALGGGDNLSLAVGVASERQNLLGEGRLVDANTELNGVPSVPRNAPTTFNIAAWDEVLFHDGRVESLGKTPSAGGDDHHGIRTPDVAFGERDALSGNNLVTAQARFPLTSREEMKGFNHEMKDNQEIRDYLASRIGNYDENHGKLIVPSYWLKQFQQVYQAPNAAAEILITEQNIAALISSYERSQVFTNTPWRRYIEGDKAAISESVKAGAVLFYTSHQKGGANCSSCHRGDFFTDEKFHNIATPQMGTGKGDGVDGSADFGRFRETGLEADKYAFRTPTLLNVEVTGPWSHAGAYANLDTMIWHHLDARNEVTHYETSQLIQPNITNLDKIQRNTQPALDKLDEARNAGLRVLQTIDLNDKQVAQLVDFLHALTDPCVKSRACLAKWIPDENEDPNGHQLDAIDVNGDSL